MIQFLFLFQVWKAELVLSDFVLHTMLTSSEFDGSVALELGAGTGVWPPCILDIYFYTCVFVLIPTIFFCNCTLRWNIYFEKPLLTILLFQWQGLILLLLPGMVGILLARVAKTIFLTGIAIIMNFDFSWFLVFPFWKWNNQMQFLAIEDLFFFP